MKKLHTMAGISNLLFPPKTHLFAFGMEKKFGEKYCLFLDYDGKNNYDMYSELIKLRHNFPELPTIWLIKTRTNHYWIVCCGIFTRQQVLDIMFQSDCDNDYFRAFKIYGRNVLRTTKKPNDDSKLKLIYLDTKKTKIPISKKHVELFENTFDIKDKSGSRRIDCGLETVKYYMKVR